MAVIQEEGRQLSFAEGKTPEAPYVPPWKEADGPQIAELLGYEYSERFQSEFAQLLENQAFKKWVMAGKDPLVFAETYFSPLGPHLPKIKSQTPPSQGLDHHSPDREL